MSHQGKSKLIAFLVGVLLGVFIMACSAVVLYKCMKRYSFTVRYDTKAMVEEASQNSSAIQSENNDSTKQLMEGFDVFIASSLDRVFRDGKTLVKPTFSANVDLSLAKNEYESFQVVVKNGKEPVKAVRLEFSDLVNEATADKISKEHINWNVVGYIPTKKPYYSVKYVGLWPDPLMPPAPTDINSGEAQPFWVTIYIPKEVKPGTYTGDIHVIAADGGEHQTIPMKVNVYRFILPKENHLKTAFDFYGHIMYLRYPQGEKEDKEAYQARLDDFKDKFIIEMLKHRMNPILNVNPLDQKDLAKVDRYRWHGLNNFSVGRHGGTFANNWPYDDEELEKLLPVYRGYGETLMLNKMLDDHYIYTWDEGKIGDPQVAKVTSLVHRAYAKLKNMVCYHGFWDPKEFPDWGKDIDIWCFQISDFNQRKIDALKELGMEMWMYISGPSDDGTPNLAMDFDSIDYRIVPWMCWKYDIKGFLYWSVNYWEKADPFKTAANTKWEQNGNGLLMYPHPDGPVVSLRMSIYRDGMEDYEYLAILSELVGSFEKKQLQNAHADIYQKAKMLLNVDSSLIDSTRSFTKEEVVLKNRRHELAMMIEKFIKILNENKTTESVVVSTTP